MDGERASRMVDATWANLVGVNKSSTEESTLESTNASIQMKRKDQPQRPQRSTEKEEIGQAFFFSVLLTGKFFVACEAFLSG